MTSIVTEYTRSVAVADALRRTNHEQPSITVGDGETESDLELLERYYGCDGVAFTEFAGRYSARLQGWFRRWAVPVSDLGDLEQETLVRISGTKESGRRGTYGPLDPWVSTIARRLKIDFFRKRKPVVSLSSLEIAEPPIRDHLSFEDRDAYLRIVCEDILPEVKPVRRAEVC